jgi:hypothetical protein
LPTIGVETSHAGIARELALPRTRVGEEQRKTGMPRCRPCPAGRTDVELRRRAVGRSRADEVQAGERKAIPTALGCYENTVVHTRVEVGEIVALSGCGRLDLKGDRPTAVVISNKERLFRQSLPTSFIVGARDGGTLR